VGHHDDVGERAHCVIMDGHNTELYYTVWGATALDVDLIAGPEAACRQIRRLYEPTESLREPVWVEAAALVDIPRRVLAVFSWHFEGYAHRAAWRAVLARTWPGWDLQWAYAGIEDIARYSGAPASPTGRAGLTPSWEVVDPADTEGLDEMDTLVTVAEESGPTRAYGMWSDVTDVFWAGPALLDQLSDAGRITTLPRLPETGLHLDPATRTATGWTTLEVAGLADEWPHRWPGWRLEFHDDRYDSQLARCAGGLTVPLPTTGDGLDILARRLASEAARSSRVPADLAAVNAAIVQSRRFPADPPRWPALTSAAS
jgi:hypothetical protein